LKSEDTEKNLRKVLRICDEIVFDGNCGVVLLKINNRLTKYNQKKLRAKPISGENT
jgi:hypothetical protein